jgi:hypothetical protein
MVNTIVSSPIEGNQALGDHCLEFSKELVVSKEENPTARARTDCKTVQTMISAAKFLCDLHC